MARALTPLPVLGVPVESRTLHGVDSLLSIGADAPELPSLRLRSAAPER